MRTLFLDLASAERSIAIIDNQSVYRYIIPSLPSEQLIESIRQLLEQKNLEISSVHRIATIIGPGGFMSLRESIAIANSLSQVLKVPLAGIHASDLLFARLASTKQCLWVHSTRKELVFVRNFFLEYTQWNEPTLVSLETLTPLKNIQYIGELIPAHQAALPVWNPCALHSLEDVLPRYIETLTYSRHSLAPWYGREA